MPYQARLLGNGLHFIGNSDVEIGISPQHRIQATWIFIQILATQVLELSQTLNLQQMTCQNIKR